MAPPSLLDKLREWIGGIGFDIFLWSIRMTQDEYLDAVIEDARRAAKSEKDSAWFTL